MRSFYVLAKYNHIIELVGVGTSELGVGQSFDRMPGTVRQSWLVIKNFDHSESTAIEALMTLMGHEPVRNLFKVEMPEP